MANGSWRTIQENETYEASRDQLFWTAQDADRILNDVVSMIATAPDLGEHILGPLWGVPVDESAVSPAVVIYYMWDDESVTLVDMSNQR